MHNLEPFVVSPQIQSLRKAYEPQLGMHAGDSEIVTLNAQEYPNLPEINNLIRKGYLQELLLSQGRLVEEIFQYIVTVGHARLEDIHALIKKSRNVVDGEFAQMLLHVFHNQAAEVKKFNEIYETNSLKHEFITYLLRDLEKYDAPRSSNDGRKSIENAEDFVEVRMCDLGVIVEVTDNKFFSFLPASFKGRIDFQTNVTLNIGGKVFKLNIIFLSNWKDQLAVRHELVHAIQANIAKLLLGQPTRDINFNNLIPPSDMLRVNLDSRTLSDSNEEIVTLIEVFYTAYSQFGPSAAEEQMKKMPEYSVLLQKLLNFAKNEMIASLNGSLKTIKNKFKDMKIQYDAYDFLYQFKAPDTETEQRVANIIWQDYCEILDDSLSKFVEHADAISNNFGPKLRLLANALQYKQLQDWKNIFEDIGIYEEFDLDHNIVQILYDIDEVLETLENDPRYKNSGILQYFAATTSKLWQLNRKRMGLVRNRSHHALLRPLSKIYSDALKIKESLVSDKLTNMVIIVAKTKKLLKSNRNQLLIAETSKIIDTHDALSAFERCSERCATIVTDKSENFFRNNDSPTNQFSGDTRESILKLYAEIVTLADFISECIAFGATYRTYLSAYNDDIFNSNQPDGFESEIEKLVQLQQKNNKFKNFGVQSF